MRKLKFQVVMRRGALPAIAVLSVSQVELGCSGQHEVLDKTAISDDAGFDASAGGGGPGGGSGGTNIFMIDASGGSGGTLSNPDGSAQCQPGALSEYTVEIPQPGTPADAGQICSVSVDPVESNQAARISLSKYSPTLELAQGFVAVEPALLASVVGLPQISVADASRSELRTLVTTNVQRTATGFAFDASWPTDLMIEPDGYARLSLKASFEVDCGNGTTRRVESLTHLDLCIDGNTVEWVSSGDQCTICRIIAEMAPSPIVPELQRDELPLARVLRLRLRALARVGRSVVLLAENDGGESVDYSWHPEAGELVEVCPDIVLWTPPDSAGPHFVQASASTGDGLAVATFAWGEVA